MRSLWRTNKETAEIYERNVGTVYRVCFLFFRGNLPDVEDAVQTTFLALMKNTKPFRDLEHEKAWLIVTASNICKNALASSWNKRVDMDEQSVRRLAVPFNVDETLQSVMTLPDKYKTAIYMFYYEGYSAKEIAGYMGKTESSVWGYLHQGRNLLKRTLKEGN
ncbi:MAG: RNA polymerase sigma factor [Clostridia bacterium]|nr:RNA polymerase sigma factor [Clostridia bacterium]